jgi:hypothetical protein
MALPFHIDAEKMEEPIYKISIGAHCEAAGAAVPGAVARRSASAVRANMRFVSYLRSVERLTAGGQVHHEGCKSKDPMPAAMSSPTCPCTDRGCSAKVRFDPPTRTFAPRPAAMDISADAPV